KKGASPESKTPISSRRGAHQTHSSMTAAPFGSAAPTPSPSTAGSVAVPSTPPSGVTTPGTIGAVVVGGVTPPLRIELGCVDPPDISERVKQRTRKMPPVHHVA